MFVRKVGLVWLLLVVGLPAAAAQDLQGTRSTGMGGTLRAAPSGDTAVLLNPAGMSLAKAYIINGLYQYRGSDAGSLVHASVVDSATKTIAAGLYYSYVHATPERTLYNLQGGGTFDLKETIDTHEAGLALSYPLANLVHLGVTSKYVNIGVDQPEDTPEAVQTDGDSGFTMDIGMIVTPFPGFNLGVVYANAIPIEHPDYTRQLGMGVAYAMGTKFLAEFDVVLDFDRSEETKASYHGGGELFLGGSFALRGGVMHDTGREATYATGGLGLVTKNLALDFGLRQMVDGGAESLLAFSARLFLH